MQVELSLTKDISVMAAHADEAERVGFDGMWIGETRIDPMPSLAIAAAATQTISLGTGVYIAFARTPMVTAYAARELAKVSSGRFVLGLGSQVKGHIERRFSMPWSHPTARMSEYVAALHAIWSSWQTGDALSFSGDFYRHTLMTPFFSPAPDGWAPPPVYLAGVGSAMTELAGEVADGYLLHPFTTPSYCREVTVPALQRGLAKSGRPSSALRIGASLFAVPVAGEPEYLEAREAARQSVAFYASTPPYRRVLEHHGWGDMHLELNALSRRGQWQEMAHLVDDAMLDEFAMIDEPHRLAHLVAQRFGDLIDAVTVGGSHPLPTELHAATVESFHSLDSRRGW